MSDRQCIPGLKEAFKQDHIPDAEPTCTLAERDAAVEAMRQAAVEILKREAFGAWHLEYDESATEIGVAIAKTVRSTNVENAKKILALPGGDHALRLALARQSLAEAQVWHDRDIFSNHKCDYSIGWSCWRVISLQAAVAAIEKEKTR